jgi:hypothetical protein
MVEAFSCCHWGGEERGKTIILRGSDSLVFGFKDECIMHAMIELQIADAHCHIAPGGQWSGNPDMECWHHALLSISHACTIVSERV